MSVYRFGPFQLNEKRGSLSVNGEPVALGPRVVHTLLALVENAGTVLDKNVLLDRIWPEGFVEEANLTQNIYVLRKTLAAHGLHDAIETVPRRGYRFTLPVRQLADAPSVNEETQHASVFRRRIVAALSGLAFVAASFGLVASSGNGPVPPSVLSDRGERLYQIGLYYWNLRTREGVQKSLSYFSQVVQMDPLSARGYAALADVNATMGDYCYGTHRPKVYFARARAYAQKALALDPNSAEAHAALGFVALENKDISTGLAELRHASTLDASYGPAHEWYGIALLGRGDVAQALRQFEIASTLDPLSVVATAWLASASLQTKRFGDAVTYSRQALELSPQRTDALLTIGQTYVAQGNYAAAITTFKRYAATAGYFRAEGAAMLARAYALNKQMQQARAEFDFARAHARQVNPVDLLAAASAIGVPDAASSVLRNLHTHRMAFEYSARSE